jgi:hypothetical protein
MNRPVSEYNELVEEAFAIAKLLRGEEYELINETDKRKEQIDVYYRHVKPKMDKIRNG